MAKYRAKQKSILHGGVGGTGLRHAAAGTDWLTIALCLACSAFGLLLVHSVTYLPARQAEKLTLGLVSPEVFTMAAAVAVGLVFALAISFLDYELLLKFWFILAGGCLALMLLLKTRLGVSLGRDDAIRWLDFFGGERLLIQPSEFLKMGFIVSFTWHLHRERERINKVKTILLLGAHALVPFGLAAYTGDLGSAIVFLFITAGMLFIAGLKLRWFAALLGLLGAAFPVVWIYFINSFQKMRIYAVYFPFPEYSFLTEAEYKDKIFQQQQAVNAIGSGQIFGKGLFNHTVDVPVQESDMIFSVAGEALGFVGCVAVLLLLALVVVRMILVSSRTRNLRARLLCAGVALMIGGQAIINIGVCLKLLPVTGITLPFISAGGSSNLSLYLTIGLALTVFRHQNEHEDTQSYFDYLYS
ncbi:MAG: FtsW/RodA/SpoVE family cell cycle protein [Oscillospiraceae bacterium]|jgi:rod shape determining protein RodA|nr:FtsW/RodA/SpoVE family cell cycle protein [Oscillospiraceae bacterium]